MSGADLWAVVESAFAQICDSYTAGRFVPLLEADIAGYVYHVLVKGFAGDAKLVHLSTRLLGTGGKDKYDLVIGEVLDTQTLKELVIQRAGDKLDSDTKRILGLKSVRSGFRPSVRGQLIIEFKHFADGFDPQQLRIHAQQAIEDVRKLVKLAKLCPKGRGVALFDEKGYINDVR